MTGRRYSWPVADRLTQGVIDRLRRFPAGRRVVAYVLLALLVGVSVGMLVVLNLAVRRLWGELVYAVVVMAVALWALGQTRVVRETLEHFGEPAFSLKRALIWSALLLVAVPVAIVHWPWGAAALAIGPILAVILYVTRDPDDPKWWRSPWVWAAGGIGLVLVVATVPPRIGAARSPEEAPRAVAEVPEEQTLASSVRPILLFDELEQRYPVDIGALMARGYVEACREALGSDVCEPVRTLEAIDLGADYLAFEDVRGGVRGGGDASAYYYRVDERSSRAYVDYWWFFTRNPTPVAAGVFCAPGFRLPGKTCHEHLSDWEGVTVVLGPCPGPGSQCASGSGGRRWVPIAVRYAQHEFVVSYPWRPTLLRLWSDVPNRNPLRPVVFIARDSHASYPGRCPRSCKQFRAFLGRAVGEATHDGEVPWSWNGPECDDCLQRLPLTSDDAPAEWSAFEGRWGDQHCLLSGAYCDTSGAPRAPPQQERYDDPAEAGPWVCLSKPEDPSSRALRRCSRSATPEGRLPT